MANAAGVVFGDASITVITVTDAANPLIAVEAVPLEIVLGKNGEAVFDCGNVQWLNLAGEPSIPWKVMTMLLSPDADLASVSTSISNTSYEAAAGTWKVSPTLPVMRFESSKQTPIWPEGKSIVNGYDVHIYENDAFWPEATARLLCTGQLRDYKLAQVAIPLVRYNPVTEELLKLTDASVTVNFDHVVMPQAMSTLGARPDRIGKARLQKLAVNYEQAISAYGAGVDNGVAGASVQADGNDPNAGYAIITTSAIEANSTKLLDFVAHKELMGFEVQVITEADFGGGTGDAAAENIRQWLAENYLTGNIEYVLLIGDPDPCSGDVPMKMLWSRNTHTSDEDVPSDYYYADLTGNWDLDGDGYFGEWEDDFGPGGVDRFWEVSVGRIPYYGSIGDLDAILQKTIDYESQYGASENWRKNVLLPMGDDPNDRYLLGEAIRYNVLEPKRWSSHRIYKEDYGVVLPPETIPTTYDNVTSVWNGDANDSDGKFGLVVWWAHGNSTLSQDIIDVAHVADLNDKFPSLTFQASCSNSYPAAGNNLSYELLRNGGVCTIGATRNTFSNFSEPFAGMTTDSGMAYEYTQRVVSEQFSSGVALNDLREILLPANSTYWQNFLGFNVYGDSSLCIVRCDPPYYAPVTYHVDGLNGSNDSNGLNWDNAFEDVQKALSAAKENDQIWVAQGVYTPTDPNGNRDCRFNLTPYTQIYGGFPTGGGSWNERDPSLYESVLSGDLKGDDTGDFNSPSRNENSYNVVRGVGDFVMDGFTITDGRANGGSWGWQERGGGMVVEQGSAMISNCMFTSNSAEFYGGGAYIGYSKPTFFNCAFAGNFAQSSGGGIYSGKGGPTLTNCIFTLDSTGWQGGGVSSYKSDVTLTGCTFSENSTLYYGGGMQSNGGAVALTNCLFVLNSKTSDSGNGGGCYASGGSLILTNCTFVNNSGPTDAGGLGSHGCNVVMTNCIFWGNTTYQILSALGAPDMTYSCIQGGWPGDGNIDIDPYFVDPCNGDYHLQSEIGSWDGNAESWATDANTSSCIDAGDPNSDWTGELWPHGKRVNMGAYGGTAEASMSLSDVGNIANLDNDANDLVNLDDLALFVNKWCYEQVLIPEDLSRDSVVNFIDYSIFAANFLGGTAP